MGSGRRRRGATTCGALLGATLALPAGADAYLLIVLSGREHDVVVQRDGAPRAERRLASGVFDVAIAPGGGTIALGRRSDTTVRTLAGDRARRISRGSPLGLSADGSRVLVEGDRGDLVIGPGLRVTLPDAIGSVLSPDGRRVAWLTINDERLRLRALDGGRTVAVPVKDDEGVFGAAWTAAGLVVGVSTGSSRQRIDLVSDSGNRRPLARAGEDTFGVGPVSRDGRFVLLERVSESRDVVGLELLDAQRGTVRRLGRRSRAVVTPVGFCEDSSCAYYVDGLDLRSIDLASGARRLVRRGVTLAVAG